MQRLSRRPRRSPTCRFRPRSNPAPPPASARRHIDAPNAESTTNTPHDERAHERAMRGETRPMPTSPPRRTCQRRTPVSSDGQTTEPHSDEKDTRTMATRPRKNRRTVGGDDVLEELPGAPSRPPVSTRSRKSSSARQVMLVQVSRRARQQGLGLTPISRWPGAMRS